MMKGLNIAYNHKIIMLSVCKKIVCGYNQSHTYTHKKHKSWCPEMTEAQPRWQVRSQMVCSYGEAVARRSWIDTTSMWNTKSHLRFQFCLDLAQTLKTAVHESLDVTVMGEFGIFCKADTQAW